MLHPIEVFQALLNLKWKLNKEHPISFTLDKNNILTITIYHGNKRETLAKAKFEDCRSPLFWNEIWDKTRPYFDNTLDL